MTADLVLTIPGARLDELAREVIAAALPLGEIARIRRELMLTVATISAEEGGGLLGVSPRHFRSLCEAHGVPCVALGYKTPRYRIAAIDAALDNLSIAAKADLEASRSKLVEISSRLVREIEALAA